MIYSGVAPSSSRHNLNSAMQIFLTVYTDVLALEADGCFLSKLVNITVRSLLSIYWKTKQLKHAKLNMLALFMHHFCILQQINPYSEPIFHYENRSLCKHGKIDVRHFGLTYFCLVSDVTLFPLKNSKLKGTATLMISMFYQKELYEPRILIQVSSKSVDKWGRYGHFKNSIWPTFSRHFEYFISF